jgi:plasmid replication initiation protein
MNANKLTVCKANKLIEATYRMSLNEKRVINACIAQIDSTAPLTTQDKFELSAKDFAKLFGISEKRAYTDLQDIAKTLYERSLTIHNPDPAQPKLKKLVTRWISSIGYVPDDGKISLRFAQDILPYLSELKEQFTKYELTQISGMTCIYAYRLYELLMQWKSTGKREIEIEWLKEHLELEDGYNAMCDFKKRVIDPAVKDINEHSSYQVRWEQRKTGRKVTHLIFTFSEKKSPEAIAEAEAAKEKARQAKQAKNTLKGVPFTEIMKENGIDEPYEVTAARINRNKAAVPVSELLKTVLKKPQPAAPVVPPSAESEAHRISVINFYINRDGKEKYLAELKEKGFVSIHGIGGAIIEPDLRLAGLFD